MQSRLVDGWNLELASAEPIEHAAVTIVNVALCVLSVASDSEDCTRLSTAFPKDDDLAFVGAETVEHPTVTSVRAVQCAQSVLYCLPREKTNVQFKVHCRLVIGDRPPIVSSYK